MSRRAGWVLVWTVLCVAGCGDEGGEPVKRVEPQVPAAQPPAAESWHVVMTLALDIEGARQAGSIAADESAERVLAEVVAVASDRLRLADVGRYEVRARDGGRFEVRFAALAPERREEVTALLTRAGTLEFLIEVLPDEEYKRRLDPGDAEAARRGLWKGSAEAFEAFKQSEAAVWRRAAEVGAAYVPSMPAYRLVREAGMDGSDDAHFHLLEVPSAQETFDGGMLKDPLVSMDQRGLPVVVFEVDEAWQARLGDWTDKNVMLPVAIVLDGEYRMAPTIRARLTSKVQISMGNGPQSDQEREAKALATVLRTGALKVPAKLVSIDER